jgi:hypothetical protein
MKSSLLLLAVLTCLLPSCVLGRRTINPSVPSSSHATTRGTIALGSIEDLRVFQNKPSDPSTPSVNGDCHSMSAAEKSRMVGRQRNSFGKAMGDIALPSGQSIRTKTFSQRPLLVAATACLAPVGTRPALRCGGSGRGSLPACGPSSLRRSSNAASPFPKEAAAGRSRFAATAPTAARWRAIATGTRLMKQPSTNFLRTLMRNYNELAFEIASSPSLNTPTPC